VPPSWRARALVFSLLFSFMERGESSFAHADSISGAYHRSQIANFCAAMNLH
jgi:hypothetical protein